MRLLLVSSLLAISISASAADLQVAVARNGFSGPIAVMVAPRVEGNPPEWLPAKTLAAGKPAVTFTGLARGLYIVMVQGPQPLQRLSAKANVGADGQTLRFAIPKGTASLRVMLAGEPIARAAIVLTQDELRWETELETDDEGRFEGDLWEPGLYTAHVRRDRNAAPHLVDVTLSAKPLTIAVPDRHITGHILGGDAKPVAGATVILRSQNEQSTLSIRTSSAPDGRFEFFGVREGSHALSARAPSYLNSDAVAFELRGLSAQRTVDLALARGTQRSIRVVDRRGDPIANASLLTACDGHVKSTAVTNAEGRAQVSLPDASSCTVYALPKEGSIGMSRVAGTDPLVLRVPEGSSSLRLALKSASGEAFSDLWLLMRIDGAVVPPAVARQLINRGFALVTDTAGSISLAHIPPGTYEFWPYRSEAEGQALYDVASGFEPPITVNVLTGENDVTVRFQSRR